MSLDKNKLISYEEYLKKLTKKELTSILDTLEIEYSAKLKNEELVSLIIDELDDIVAKTLSFFTNLEYRKLKYIIKKGGHIRLISNVGLMQFCQMLTNRHLMYKIDDKKYMLFKEVYKIFKVKYKQKKVIKKCQKNSDELHLIWGAIKVYGAISLKNFYPIYSQKYEISEKDLKEYLISLEKYNGSYVTYEDKNNFYLANKKIKNLKQCKKYADAKERKEYSYNELQKLYTLRYLKKKKSYRKLRSFITNSYYIEKDNFSVVVESVLLPFIEEYELNKTKANEVLDKLIDDYFEFNSVKYKNKFIDLANELAKDYPSWDLNGYSEREKE